MVENRTSEIAALRIRVEQVGEYLHIAAKRAQYEQLVACAAEPGFWDDASAAQQTMAQSASLKSDCDDYDAALEALDDLEAGNELALAADDEALAAETANGIESLTATIDTLELASWFDGEFDHGDAIITVNPGAGGLEAQDWCEMLFKMYLHYAERRRWKVEINDAPAGEAIGLDHATFTIHGKNVYGMLRSEQGVHRLVRISPTDDKKRRHTTFASVEVLPLVPEEIEIDIDANDLRIDVYRSSGPGGQSVNTTDSAVRITHLPTGIVVTCQNEKSQIQNKEVAMRILRSRLYEIERERREQELDELRGPRQDNSFGSQIRNYVLYPYQMVKDLRSDVETGNVDAVLDGALDQFVIGYHRWRVSQK